MSELATIWMALIVGPFVAYLIYGLAGVLAGVSIRKSFLDFKVGSVIAGLVGFPAAVFLAPVLILIGVGYAGAGMARETGHSFVLWGALCTALPLFIAIPAWMASRQASL